MTNELSQSTYEKKQRPPRCIDGDDRYHSDKDSDRSQRKQ